MQSSDLGLHHSKEVTHFSRLKVTPLVRVDGQRYSKSAYTFFHEDLSHSDSLLVWQRIRFWPFGEIIHGYQEVASVTGSGPNASTASLSIGEATLYCASSAQIFFGGWLPHNLYPTMKLLHGNKAIEGMAYTCMHMALVNTCLIV